jgi:non-canonical poly(A) RNA polymerase PAPD5/7
METGDDFISLSSFNDLIQTKEEIASNLQKQSTIERSHAHKYSLSPWCTQEYTHTNLSIRLHAEILDFCTYVSPTPEEHMRRIQLIERIQSVVQSIWSNSKVVPFGSFATKLYLPISDIDLVLFGSENIKGRNALNLLEDELKRRDMASYMEVIAKARVTK